jgi:hypothetical protein
MASRGSRPRAEFDGRTVVEQLVQADQDTPAAISRPTVPMVRIQDLMDAPL